MPTLTKRQKEILDFIKSYIKKSEYSPTFKEIKKKFKLSALSTVHQHVEALINKGYLIKNEKSARGIELKKSYEDYIQIPLVGLITAGQPIEAIEERGETIAISKINLPKNSEIFGLRVSGDSMINENINDGDIVIIKKQQTAEDGDKVVALIDNFEATLKKIYRHNNKIKLQPANAKLKPLIIDPEQLNVQGIVIDVIKKNIPIKQNIEIPKKEETKLISDGKSTIFKGDCLNVLKNIKDNSIDLIFADPPYNIGKDFGNNIDKWESINSYIEWCKKWIDECTRVLKNDGTFYFMTATQHMPFLDIYVSKKLKIINRIIWAYDSSGVQAKKKFGSLYEPIIMAVKDENNYKFNYKDIRIEAKTGAKRKLIDYRKKIPTTYNTEKTPGNVWHFPRVRFRMEEYENHPTQKPEALLERIILASSSKGDLVLDPFAGTFSTCAVAKKNKRKTIGIELNEDYFKIGLRRLNLMNEYKGEKLIKKKIKKTNNKSKADHILKSGQLSFVNL